jgi:SAM-dependent methyltransferase
MIIREERLYPPISSARYYYLNQLRKAISSVCDQFLKNSKNLKLIDYGCGNMPYKPLLEPFVNKYIGVDLPENHLAEVHINAKGKIEMEDQSIDLVLSTQVLEHVEDPLFYLSESFRVLKPGGKLILSTHGYWMYHPDPTDYWRWTSTGLKKIVEERGFELKYFRGIIGRSAMGLQLFQDGLLFKLPKFLRPVLSIWMQPWIVLFDKIHSQEQRDKDACTFILVAEKRS